jgi:YesN/AraC family two-component response regulator
MEALKRHNYDIIMTDYRLPGMDGLEFLKRIQETQPLAMKVLITAYGSEEVISEAHGIGIQDFIEKPFTTKIIEEALSRLIKTREKGDSKTISTIQMERKKKEVCSMPRENGTRPSDLASGIGWGTASAGMGRDRGKGYSAAPSGSCICPYCGTKVPYYSGIPCFEERCPKCGTSMRRD